MTTPTKGGEEDGGSKADVFDAGKHIRQQMLLAGLSLLKGDVERLKENVSLRAAAANVDKLVRMNDRFHICTTYGSVCSQDRSLELQKTNNFSR